MRKLALTCSIILLSSCVGTKSTTTTISNTENKHILPPDTPSNKYSKTGQANRN